MRRWIAFTLVAVALVACADPSSGPGTGGSSVPSSVEPSPSPPGPARVDLVEAGLRAVLPSDGGREILFILTRLCTSVFTEEEEGEERTCDERLTDEEQRILADRMAAVADEIRFAPSYEDIPEGQAPISHPGHVVAWVGPPLLQDEGSYHMEAGETCGGLCGHGGTYVVKLRDGRWISTGYAPGTGMWIS